MMKKWRPFWSYDVEKTERFLSKMALEGKQLAHVNLTSRMFSFQEAACEEAEYQIVYDKSDAVLPRGLQESGWEKECTEGNWQFLKNTQDSIHAYPIREGILKRNKIHSTVATIIAFLSATQAFILLTFIFVLGSIDDFSAGDIAALWGFGLPFLPSIALITLAVYATRKLRAFEQKYFNTTVDTQVDGTGNSKEVLKKWRFGWTTAPDLTETWLADMSLKGYHLVRIRGARFIFLKGDCKKISYVYDYQWKVSPTYFDVHKGAGWHLVFTTPYSFNKSTFWMKEYEPTEEKPRLTYDALEKKGLVRKVLLTSGGSILYSVVLTLYIVWLYNGVYEDSSNGWSTFAKVIIYALILSIALPIMGMVRSVKYASRMKEV